MSAPEAVAIALRALVYAAAIAVAGGALFRLSFPQGADAVAPVLKRQNRYGFLLLLAVEPLRYGAFQLAISDGDWVLAFGPDMRWMAFETPIGRATLVRLAAGAVVAFAGLRAPLIAIAAALALIGSFVIEGHTAAGDAHLLVAPILFVHLAAVTWWIGALLPLLALTYSAAPATVSTTMQAFGRRAAWLVGTLLAAGAVLALVLTDGELRLDSAYHQRLLIKLGLVVGLLSFAAWNKLSLTPLLSVDYALGIARLRTSMRCEIALALAIVAASAWLVATTPAPELP